MQKNVLQKPMREISAGIVVFRETREEKKYLILYHGHGYWNFAKGKIESEERSFEAALRETQEETGLPRRDLRIVRNFKAYERFAFRRHGQKVFKEVIFYLAETKNPRIRISKEHQGYAWFTYKEGMKVLEKYHDSQKVLEYANRFLRHAGGPARLNDISRSGRPARTYKTTLGTGGEHGKQSHSNSAGVPRP